MRNFAYISYFVGLACTAMTCGKSRNADTPPATNTEPGPAGSAAGATAPSGQAAGSATATPTDPNSVCVFVGAVRATCVTNAALAEKWQRVDAMVPAEAQRLGTWKKLVIRTAAGTDETLTQPTDTYPDMVPALFVQDGKPAVGMFDLAELASRGQPKWRVADLRQVTIEIVNDPSRGQNEKGHTVTDPADLKLTVTSSAGKVTLTGAQLLALPRENMPGSEADAKGWSLATFLTAANVKAPVRVRLSDADGFTVILEKADFAKSNSVPFVKLNKQGALRFRLYQKKGEAWTATSDLRRLTSVEVLP